MPEHLWFCELTHGIVGEDPAANLLRSGTRRLARIAWNSDTLRYQMCVRGKQQTTKEHAIEPHLSSHRVNLKSLVDVREKLYMCGRNLCTIAPEDLHGRIGAVRLSCNTRNQLNIDGTHKEGSAG
jgi:hypothetical protein